MLQMFIIEYPGYDKKYFYLFTAARIFSGGFFFNYYERYMISAALFLVDNYRALWYSGICKGGDFN